MPQLDRTAAALRIYGRDLDPIEITRLLGNEPTYAQKLGDQIIGQKTGRVRIAKTGMWRLSVRDREAGDLDVQISEILANLTEDLEVWREITSKYQADLFCGLFMRHGNEGLSLSAESLVGLGARGIIMELDLYRGDDDVPESDSEQVGGCDGEKLPS